MKLPPALQRAKDIWMKFSHALGFVMSKILLSILWAVVFGLYGIVHLVIKAFSGTEAPSWKDVPEPFEGSMQRQF